MSSAVGSGGGNGGGGNGGGGDSGSGDSGGGGDVGSGHGISWDDPFFEKAFWTHIWSKRWTDK